MKKLGLLLLSMMLLLTWACGMAESEASLNVWFCPGCKGIVEDAEVCPACGETKPTEDLTKDEQMQLYEQGKNVFYAIPHSGNWEWFGKMIPELTKHKGLAIYKQVKNPVFERFMLYLRTFDSTLEMVESNSALRRLIQLRDSQNAVLMMADQTSHGLASDYWTEFLHQDTCWFTGLERIAKKLEYAIVFVDMRRQGRGRYKVSFELLIDSPKETKEGCER